MAKKSKLPVASTPVPVKIVNEAPASANTKLDDARERKWRAEDALRDIERAEGHKRDKALMSDVKKLAREKVASLKRI